jgi:hypothetical protein
MHLTFRLLAILEWLSPDVSSRSKGTHTVNQNAQGLSWPYNQHVEMMPSKANQEGVF